ncbi:MAG: hypothetical protein IJQ85_04960 [Selenomonadaceae bacterium]|nr:hypothetical protein [Selenomonadaceae bacterium]
MRNFLLTLAAILFFMSTCAAASDESDELDSAEIRLNCAICSMGAYSDNEGYLMRSILNERGWTIEKISQKNNRADAGAYLVSKGDVKILTIAGTENIKNVEMDFRVGRVHLNDNTTLAPKEKNPDDKIFVHRGFRDYADLVLSEGFTERLKTSLEKNPHETLYITGHNFGGAVATITAIRLIDSGVDKNQLKVITFGAPAIGSRALAKNYFDKINLTRVVIDDDGVKKSLRSLGYSQFGKTLEYKQSGTSDQTPQKMAVYLDCAIRDYVNVGGTFQHEAKDKIDTPIYVSPILLVKGELKSDDGKIILDTLDDILKNKFSNLTFAEKQSVEFKEKNIQDEDFDEFLEAGKNSGCKYILIRILRVKKIRDAQSDDRLATLEGIMYDTNDNLIFMQTSGMSDTGLTISEWILVIQENLNDNISSQLSMLKNFD